MSQVRHGSRTSTTTRTHSRSHSRSLSRNKSRIASSVSTYGRKSVAWRGDKTGFKMPKFQNSYRLEPYLPFRFEVSDKILVDVMTRVFEDQSYNAETCVTLCREAAASVLDRLYKTDFDRVKYVVTMTIVEKVDQGIVMLNGRLWDPIRDTYSLFVYEAPTFFAAGMAWAMYYE